MSFPGDLTPYLETARDTAIKAGQILRNRFGKSVIDFKGEIDIVTDADHASESFCAENLLSAFEETDFLGEEGRGKDTGADLCWIVDPLDGTNNYAHKIPIFCVSIALANKGRPIVGVVHAPIFNETFTATANGGAFLNGNPIHVSSITKPLGAVAVTGFPYDRRSNPNNNLDNFCVIAPEVQGIRRLGSAAMDLCWVAAGRFDAYWELRLSPWDFAAGALIAHEAGGRVTDFKNGELSLKSDTIVATNGHLHDEFLRLLRGKEGNMKQS
jgi:myo-inositol-1(or 4)-monophosphatase